MTADADKEADPEPPTPPYTYADEDLEAYTQYYYILRASNGAGAGPWSEPVSDRTIGRRSGSTGADGKYRQQQLDPAQLDDPGRKRLDYHRVPTSRDGILPPRRRYRDVGSCQRLRNDQHVDGIHRPRRPPMVLPPERSTSIASKLLPHSHPAVATSSAWSGDTPDNSTTGAASAFTAGATPNAPLLSEGIRGNNLCGNTSTSITVKWTALLEADQGGSKLTGYELRVWDSATGQWVPVATTAADAEEYEHEDLAPGTKYYYILRAVNSQGPGDWSDFQFDTTDAADSPTRRS